MKKIKLGIGAVIMICASLISERAEIIGIYFLAAFIHECGHILAAWMQKIPIKEIKLGFSGIRICTDSGVTSYKKELILAASGPLFNLLTLLLCAVIFYSLHVDLSESFSLSERFLDGGGGGFCGALGFFSLSSAMHCVVNLLPVNTFDGGRIVYCLISIIFSEEIAARVTDILSALCALILWIIALYLLLKVSSGLGVFVFAACIFMSTAKKELQSDA